MPTYDGTLFDPPAPLAHVVLRDLPSQARAYRASVRSEDNLLLLGQEVITQPFQQSRVPLRGNRTDRPDDVPARDYG